MEQDPRCSRCGLDHEHFVVDPRPLAIEMPVAGPGVPRDASGPPPWVVWLIPAAVLVVTALAILCGALWR